LAALRKPPESVRQALTGVYPTPSPSTLCAVVGGDAVLIDVEHPGRHEWLETGGAVVAVRPVVAEGLLLLATPWSITALDSSGQLWQTQRLAIDGLRMDEVSDGLLAGVADPDDMEPRDFAVDLRSGRHEGGGVVA